MCISYCQLLSLALLNANKYLCKMKSFVEDWGMRIIDGCVVSGGGGRRRLEDTL